MIGTTDLSGIADLGLLDDFLMSDRAPPESMGLSDLDGFLTGIAIGPDMLLPSEWLPVIWGDDEPEFASADEAQAIISAIMLRYGEIISALENAQEDFSPIFLEGPAGQTIAADWAAGFLDAVGLRPESWQALLRDKRAAMYATPIFLLASSDDQIPAEIKAGLAETELSDRLHELVPESVFGIDAFWQKRRKATTRAATAPVRAAGKTGRNDPCPCGSGRKYKKCCGQA